MSGIVGLVHLDGAPIDRQLLGRMTSFLAFRGPDAVHTWIGGSVGLGHTLLRTTEESANEHQPLTLDQQAWIVADARIDARNELITKLAAKGRTVSPSVPDGELILHAYHLWGEECVDHLLGDFSFAIWDASRRRLFCARDHFGVKPFFYAHHGSAFHFSNTLRCLRLHPAVSDQLDDAALADFLLFGFNREFDATAFSAIRRLPPAHTLTVAPEGLRLRRYWALPAEDLLRYRNPVEYVDQFRGLFGAAVKDRLRTSSVGVLMSGGLDSSSVAATAVKFLREKGGFDLRSYTTVSERLIPDEEGRYAGIAGESLRIPVHSLVLDEYDLYRGWEEPEGRLPEPIHDPFTAILNEHLTRMAARHRVALTGFGGDPALSTSVTSYASFLLRTGQFLRFLSDFLRFFASEGRFSRLYVNTRLRVWRQRGQLPAQLPGWLNPDLSFRLDLPHRWAGVWQSRPPAHLNRPTAYEALEAPDWPFLFEMHDAGSSGIPIECRHPFFDVRLLRFLLRVPPVPWCTDKELVRVAMRGLLPEPVRLRRKTPLAADPTAVVLCRTTDRWWEKVPPASAVARYVDWERVPRLAGTEDPISLWLNLAPCSLNLWLWSLCSGERLSSSALGSAGQAFSRRP